MTDTGQKKRCEWKDKTSILQLFGVVYVLYHTGYYVVSEWVLWVCKFRNTNIVKMREEQRENNCIRLLCLCGNTNKLACLVIGYGTQTTKL